MVPLHILFHHELENIPTVVLVWWLRLVAVLAVISWFVCDPFPFVDEIVTGWMTVSIALELRARKKREQAKKDDEAPQPRQIIEVPPES